MSRERTLTLPESDVDQLSDYSRSPGSSVSLPGRPDLQHSDRPLDTPRSVTGTSSVDSPVTSRLVSEHSATSTLKPTRTPFCPTLSSKSVDEGHTDVAAARSQAAYDAQSRGSLRVSPAPAVAAMRESTRSSSPCPSISNNSSGTNYTNHNRKSGGAYLKTSSLFSLSRQNQVQSLLRSLPGTRAHHLHKQPLPTHLNSAGGPQDHANLPEAIEHLEPRPDGGIAHDTPAMADVQVVAEPNSARHGAPVDTDLTASATSREFPHTRYGTDNNIQAGASQSRTGVTGRIETRVRTAASPSQQRSAALVARQLTPLELKERRRSRAFAATAGASDSTHNEALPTTWALRADQVSGAASPAARPESAANNVPRTAQVTDVPSEVRPRTEQPPRRILENESGLSMLYDVATSRLSATTDDASKAASRNAMIDGGQPAFAPSTRRPSAATNRNISDVQMTDSVQQYMQQLAVQLMAAPRGVPSSALQANGAPMSRQHFAGYAQNIDPYAKSSSQYSFLTGQPDHSSHQAVRHSSQQDFAYRQDAEARHQALAIALQRAVAAITHASVLDEQDAEVAARVARSARTTLRENLETLSSLIAGKPTRSDAPTVDTILYNLQISMEFSRSVPGRHADQRTGCWSTVFNEISTLIRTFAYTNHALMPKARAPVAAEIGRASMTQSELQERAEDLRSTDVVHSDLGPAIASPLRSSLGRGQPAPRKRGRQQDYEAHLQRHPPPHPSNVRAQVPQAQQPLRMSASSERAEGADLALKRTSASNESSGGAYEAALSSREAVLDANNKKSRLDDSFNVLRRQTDEEAGVAERRRLEPRSRAPSRSASLQHLRIEYSDDDEEDSGGEARPKDDTVDRYETQPNVPKSMPKEHSEERRDRDEAKLEGHSRPPSERLRQPASAEAFRNGVNNRSDFIDGFEITAFATTKDSTPPAEQLEHNSCGPHCIFDDGMVEATPRTSSNKRD